eukprot:SAG11_NODE_2061_length_3871_cov_6.900583_2_plen_285_part_00
MGHRSRRRTRDGRDCLTVKERPILLKHAANLIFIRRYVDDCGGWFRGTEQELRLFLQDYKDMSYFETTDEYSQERLIMLDVEAFKGDGFDRSGRLDTCTYQKQGNAYLYIPPWSEHPRHMRKSLVCGELIRYVKRSSDEEYFVRTRNAFAKRLRARGYKASEIREFFSRVSYDDRWKYLNLRHRIRTQAAARTAAAEPSTQNHQPAVLALTPPNSQRSTAMEAQQAIFCLSERSLKQKQYVPKVIREAQHRVALKMGKKIGGYLLESTNVTEWTEDPKKRARRI